MFHLRHTYKKYLCILTLISLLLTLSGCGNSGSNIFQQLFHIGGQNEDTAAPTTEEVIPSTEEVIPTTTEYYTEEPNTVGVEDTEEESISSDVEFQTYTYTYYNFDGYIYEITMTLSPWILESQSDVLESAWAQVGKDNPLPSTDGMSLRKRSNNLYLGPNNSGSGFYATMTEMYFSVGTISFKNVTDGWSFSSDRTGGINYQLLWGSDTDRYDNLITSADRSMMSKIYYGSGVKYTEGGFEIHPSMTSDKWGPVPFVLAHAENITPNYPEGEFRPEILVGYLDGFIRNSNGEYDHIQIRIPIYGEESVTSNSSNDNSDSQTSTSSNNGEGLFNREYIASEKKYKNYCLGFELDLVDDPNWGIVTVYDTPEKVNNQFIHYDYEKFIEKRYNGKTVDDIGATWDEKNTSIIITTSTNRIDSCGFTPEDTGIDTDFDDAYQFSEFYINFFKDIILKQGGICENLGRVEINGINGCLVKVRWADSSNTLIIFFSDKLDSDACFDMQIDTGTPSDERIPEVLEYLNQHLRKIN